MMYGLLGVTYSLFGAFIEPISYLHHVPTYWMYDIYFESWLIILHTRTTFGIFPAPLYQNRSKTSTIL